MLKPQRFGRYILLDRLSTGGMAEVFLAKSSGLQGFEKVIAIKRILPSVSEDSDFTTMFIDEAKISANLTHANIGQVFEFGQVNGQYYIAMEYIAGRDLRAIHSHLADTGRAIDLCAALHIATRLCQALDYAHRQKNAAGVSMDIVHRDVSPPNVIVSFDGAVKLIDFGIAKAASRATRTRAGKLKGKFSYMSPEQVQGLPVDRRSDIFSLGVLLHEQLTGRRLFHGENQLATLNLVRKAEVAAPSTLNPEVPLEIDRIVLKALARDREERYSWATELRADIERFLARNGIIFESQQLAAWMRAEFAGEIEAERLMQERIHTVSLDDIEELPVTPAGPELGALDDEEEPLPETAPLPSPGAFDASHRPTSRWRRPDEITAQAGPGTPLPAPANLPVAGLASTAPAGIRDAPTVAASGRARARLIDSAAADLDDGSELASVDAVDQPADDELPLDTPESVRSEGAGALLAADSSPRILGPQADKEDDPLAHISTAYHLTPPPGHELPNSGTISPGQDRDAATVGGALEIDSNPDRPSPEVADEEPVDLTALGPDQVESRQLSDPTAHSGTRQVTTRRLSGVKVAILAGGVTLALAAILFLAIGPSRGRDPGGSGGSVVVTTRPLASCSVALALTPKGLLQPGGTLTLNAIPPGRHLISLQCLGFQPYATTVEVKTAQAIFVVATLKKKK